MNLSGVDAVLLAFAVLLTKHMIADFVLQTAYQWRNKGYYGHPGGVLHALIHVILTPLVFLVIAPASAPVGAAILGAEFLIHYHIDWLKEQVVRSFAMTSDSDGFWRALGIDQLAHGLTYVGIVWALLHVTALP